MDCKEITNNNETITTNNETVVTVLPPKEAVKLVEESSVIIEKHAEEKAKKAIKQIEAVVEAERVAMRQEVENKKAQLENEYQLKCKADEVEALKAVHLAEDFKRKTIAEAEEKVAKAEADAEAKVKKATDDADKRSEQAKKNVEVAVEKRQEAEEAYKKLRNARREETKKEVLDFAMEELVAALEFKEDELTGWRNSEARKELRDARNLIIDTFEVSVWDLPSDSRKLGSRFDN